MILRPPRSTRTDTLFPYTTLFRSPPLLVAAERVAATVEQGVHGRRRVGPGDAFWQFRRYSPGDAISRIDSRQTAKRTHTFIRANARSEERREGKECVSTCRSRWSTDTSKKKTSVNITPSH